MKKKTEKIVLTVGYYVSIPFFIAAHFSSYWMASLEEWFEKKGVGFDED